nr:MAG TPA: hypothetical protein [Caudoviricetes sp.]
MKNPGIGERNFRIGKRCKMDKNMFRYFRR